MRLWITMWLITSFGLFFSCHKAPHLKPGYERPEEVVERYFQALQWRDYDKAREFIAQECYPAFEDFIQANSHSLNLIDYKIQGVELGEEGYLAKVKIKLSYFIVPSVNPQEGTIIQTWKLVKGKWLLLGPPF